MGDYSWGGAFDAQADRVEQLKDQRRRLADALDRIQQIGQPMCPACADEWNDVLETIEAVKDII